jgi:hypothetical protein
VTTVPDYHNVTTVPDYHNVTTVPDYHNVDDTFYVMTLRDDRFAERHRLKIVITRRVSSAAP